jgi:thiamine biosynthesis lipoprotein
MGTRAHVIVSGSSRLISRARRRIEALEQRWSRFRPTSELNRLNARAGETTTVSEDTRLLLERALEGWSISGGAFDPTLLGDVVRAGYDRTFVEIEPRALSPLSHHRAGSAGIRLQGNDVYLPAGIGIDSGGIGKGLAADLVVSDLLEAGAEGALVNLGGDLCARGASPDGSGWTIAIEHPWNGDDPVVLVGLADGGLATSTTLKRRWIVGSELRHHLIDPRSHEPADSGINHATVVAKAAWLAEVLAKAVLLNGRSFPFDILGGTGAQGMAVTDEGDVVTSEGFATFTGGQQLPSRLGEAQERGSDEHH